MVAHTNKAREMVAHTNKARELFAQNVVCTHTQPQRDMTLLGPET
jgi:hypothetical protein